MTDPVSIMVTGDLHLGIHPSKIPEDIDGKSYSPGSVWQAIVDEVLRQELDGVVITGDIVDQQNDFFEAWGPFESGLDRLAAADIPVFMVAGNHDAGVLGEFIDSMDLSNCQLVGPGGQWQRVPLEIDGETVISFDGWSYPTRHVRENPLKQYNLPESDLPVLGILHTEMNRADSRYAPVMEADLKDVPIDGWLLGHIHKPECHSERPLILNPGSPQPLNPKETGVHGPWQVSVDVDGKTQVEQLPMATIQYLNLTVNVSELERVGDLTGAIKRAVEHQLQEQEPANDRLEALSVRLTLEGEVPFREGWEETLDELNASFRPRIQGKQVFVERIRNRSRPPLDLQTLAEGTGPVARLADLARRLEKEGREALPAELQSDVEEKLDEVYRANTYQPLRNHADLEKPGPKQTVMLVKSQAYRLLRELQSEKDQSS